MAASAQRGAEGSAARQAPMTSSAPATGRDLFERLLAQGHALLECDAELFKTAVAKLAALVPREGSPVRRAPGAEQKGVPANGGARRSATSFRKYDLPNNNSQFEYYQCMVCQERRPTNSFHADHQHGTAKPDVRWYCPLCDTFFAVTHRGYHIKNIHPSKPRTPGTRARAHAEAAPAATTAATEAQSVGEGRLAPEAPPKRGRYDTESSSSGSGTSSSSTSSRGEDAYVEVKREEGADDENDDETEDDRETENDNDNDSLSDAAAPADALLLMRSSSRNSLTNAPAAAAPAPPAGTVPVAGAPGTEAAGAVAAVATAPAGPTVTSEALTQTPSFYALGIVQPPMPGPNPLAQSGSFMLPAEFAGTARPM